jgi:hypothetical protein
MSMTATSKDGTSRKAVGFSIGSWHLKYSSPKFAVVLGISVPT